MWKVGIKKWFNVPEKIRFLFVGGFNAGIAYIIYFIFCLIFGESKYQIALIISWIISSFVSFNTQKYLVFSSKGNWFKEYIKCCATWFFSYLINAGLLEIFVKILKLNVFVSQILAVLCAAVFTYISFKIFAFKISSEN